MTRRSSRSSGKTCAIAAANVPEALERRLAWSGVVYLLLAAASFAFTGPYPGPDEQASELADFYSERNRLLASMVFAGLALSSFIVFLGALRAALRREEGEAGVLSAIATISGSVYVAVALVEHALRASIGLAPERADSLHDSTILLLVISSFALAPLVAAASAAGRETRLMPQRLWVFGFVVAALQLVAGASLASSGIFSPGGAAPIVAWVSFALWLVSVSVVLTRAR
jgi:hypothetical protein